jgi:hypothetical protein
VPRWRWRPSCVRSEAFGCLLCRTIIIFNQHHGGFVLLHFKCFTSRLSLAVMSMTGFHQCVHITGWPPLCLHDTCSRICHARTHARLLLLVIWIPVLLCLFAIRRLCQIWSWEGVSEPAQSLSSVLLPCSTFCPPSQSSHPKALHAFFLFPSLCSECLWWPKPCTLKSKAALSAPFLSLLLLSRLFDTSLARLTLDRLTLSSAHHFTVSSSLAC